MFFVNSLTRIAQASSQFPRSKLLIFPNGRSISRKSTGPRDWLEVKWFRVRVPGPAIVTLLQLVGESPTRGSHLLLGILCACHTGSSCDPSTSFPCLFLVHPVCPSLMRPLHFLVVLNGMPRSARQRTMSRCFVLGQAMHRPTRHMLHGRSGWRGFRLRVRFNPCFVCPSWQECRMALPRPRQRTERRVPPAQRPILDFKSARWHCSPSRNARAGKS